MKRIETVTFYFTYKQPHAQQYFLQLHMHSIGLSYGHETWHLISDENTILSIQNKTCLDSPMPLKNFEDFDYNIFAQKTTVPSVTYKLQLLFLLFVYNSRHENTQGFMGRRLIWLLWKKFYLWT